MEQDRENLMEGFHIIFFNFCKRIWNHKVFKLWTNWNEEGNWEWNSVHSNAEWNLLQSERKSYLMNWLAKDNDDQYLSETSWSRCIWSAPILSNYDETHAPNTPTWYFRTIETMNQGLTKAPSKTSSNWKVLLSELSYLRSHHFQILKLIIVHGRSKIIIYIWGVINRGYIHSL